MNLIVHRGTQQIGGSCVEVQSGQDRILLDLGLPLPTKEDDALQAGQSPAALLASGVLPPINGVYAGSTPDACAVVMSHVHPDAHHRPRRLARLEAIGGRRLLGDGQLSIV